MARELPIFPLPIVLFPGTPQPLHVFEPRYRQLLADCLAADRRFGIAYVPAEPEPGSEPLPRPGDVGCVALIQNTQALPDGRSNILTVGERRFVLIDWVGSDRPYRLARVEEFDDEPVEASETVTLAGDVREGFTQLAQALSILTGREDDVVELAPDPQLLSFQVAAALELAPEAKRALLALRSTTARLRQLATLVRPLAADAERRAAVLLVLTRLNRILSLDPGNRVAVVEPGVVNVRLSAAAAAHGLHYAPDPSSQTACTIGGNVAENAGGPHCLKYGVTAQHVLALEVVLADGRIVELGSPGGEPWGPDVVGLFVGSEGNFGIATRIAVRLLPLPRAVRTLLAAFASLRAAGEAVSAVIASGIVPAALEMMDQSCIRAVEDSVYAAGYPRDAAAVLLVELDGHSDEAVAADTETVQELLSSHDAASIRVAADAGERERLWQGRKKAFGAMGRLSRDLVVQDAVVPRSALPDVLETIGRIAATYQVTVSNVFHAGDGNLRSEE